MLFATEIPSTTAQMKSKGERRPLGLWASPRSTSTAFDKMMRQRGDHKVFTEPFSYPFYLGPERVFSPYGEKRPDATFLAAFDEIMKENKKQPVFVKELPYQMGPLLKNKEAVLSFKGSLLIRHPAWVVPSFQRVWPEHFSEFMVSYKSLHDVFNIMRDAGEDVVVLEAHDLRNRPEKVVGAWCERMGIEARLDALQWEKGMPDDWQPWSEWFVTTSQSTGFMPVETKAYPPLTEEQAKIVDANRPLYNDLEAHKLRV